MCAPSKKKTEYNRDIRENIGHCGWQIRLTSVISTVTPADRVQASIFTYVKQIPSTHHLGSLIIFRNTVCIKPSEYSYKQMVFAGQSFLVMERLNEWKNQHKNSLPQFTGTGRALLPVQWSYWVLVMTACLVRGDYYMQVGPSYETAVQQRLIYWDKWGSKEGWQFSNGSD